MEYLLRFSGKSAFALSLDERWVESTKGRLLSGVGSREHPTSVARMGAFPGFCAVREKEDGRTYSDEAAIKGVLGMMRFSKHNSPILLDALAC